MAPTKSRKREAKIRAGKMKVDQPAVIAASQPDRLREEVFALGGDSADLELLKDVDSDAEIEEPVNSKGDANLSRDLAKFVNSLNIQSVPTNDQASAGEAEVEKVSERKEKKKTKDKPSRTEPINTDTSKGTGASTNVTNSRQDTTTKRTKLLIEPTSQWYHLIPPLSATSSLPKASDDFIASKSAHAASLLAVDVDKYKESSAHTGSTSDAQFLSRILTSGTLSDRLSALTLMTQASPVHNARALESLKAMASKKGREESLKALRAVVDWWVGGGSPDRKLKYFRDQPLTHAETTDRHLVLWYFEDWLKKYFFSILQLLETLSLDPLPYIRTQSLTLIFQLLKDKPEQEHNLLRLLVNKLGDSEKTVASRASYYLLNILQAHPQMKAIIVREASALVLKPPSTSASSGDVAGNAHARYYSVITFNQIVLNSSDKVVARQLIDVYFELFKGILGEDKRDVLDQEEKTGVKQQGRRKKKAHEIKGKDKSKGKAKDDGFAEVEDSDSKIISAILTGVNRALPFTTIDDKLFERHIDTLFRIVYSATFNISVQALVLIHQVAVSRQDSQSIGDRFYRSLYASLLDPRIATSSKQAMYLNLVFKAVKADQNLNRVKAFAKRITQSLGNSQPSYICGCLYLLGELFTQKPSLRQMLLDPEEILRKSSTEGDQDYDPRKRDPQFSHAENTCLWELVPLLKHFHPSVSLHARQLLTGAQITATADLSLNTLSHFLDRWVYKNPKKPKPRGASAMQPSMVNQEGTGMVHMLRSGGGSTQAIVNEPAFWKQNSESVPVDQLFFHKFFSKKFEKLQEKMDKVEKRKPTRPGDDSDSEANETDGDGSDGGSGDEEEEGSDAEEAKIWKAMKATMPDQGDDVDLLEDSDSIPEGLDDDEEESDDDDDDRSLKSDADSQGMSQEEGSASELDLLEDEDDLLDLDHDAPDGLLDYSSEESEWGGIEGPPVNTGKRKKREEVDAGAGKKKRKLRQLPTFASYEDYAKMIDDGPEDNI